MALGLYLSLLLLAITVSPSEANVSPGVNSTLLPRSLIVTTKINGQDISADGSTTLKYLHDNLTITWRLNESFASADLSSYKQVFVKLCYGNVSAIDRPWRKNSVDLKLSKTCKYSIKRQNFTAEGSTIVYQAPRNIPDAKYFVRAFVLNTTDTEATPGTNAVAFGHTTDPTRNKNLFHVEGYTGRELGITIATICVSVASYVILFGYFFYERSKKTDL